MTPLTQQDLLALLERILQTYVLPLKTYQGIGPGYETLQALAKAFARLSQAVVTLDDQAHVLTATGGAFATATVAFSRQNATAGAFTQLKGTQVKTSSQGLVYVLTEDVAFGALDLGPHNATVQAQAFGEEYNQPGPVTTARGEVLPGEIDTIVLPLQDPPFTDTTVRVAQVSDATGGVSASLDQLGADRGIVRQPGETDVAYRSRVRTLPDTVSPGALVRALTKIFAPLGLSFSLIESWDPALQTCWNAPSFVPPGSSYNPNLFVYNDPRTSPPAPFQNRWLSEVTFRGCVIVVVPPLTPISEVGLCYNDPGILATDFINPLGRRPPSAYNVPDDAIPAYQGCYNGYDQGGRSLYKGVYDLLQAIKAAGIDVEMELYGFS